MNIPYPLWADIGTGLKTISYPKRYITPERFTHETDPNPLANLVVLPDIPEFFATKVCNIFIVGVPYGWKLDGSEWVEEWPPPNYLDAVQRHKDTFERFTKYETHVWMDMYIVQQVMDANPDSNFENMMNATKANIEGMCSELAEYGFTYEGEFTSAVERNFFHEIIDAFNQS